MSISPTDEQALAVELFHTGRDLVVNAGAGTGKTATLELIAESTLRQGRYLAFNRAIVDEAKARMPRNVDAATLHSLAFRTTGRKMAHRLNASRLPSWKTAQLLGLDPIKVTVGDVGKVLQPGWLAGHVMRAVTVFCHSSDPEPGVKHFTYVEGLDLRTDDGARTFGNNRQLADALVSALRRAWVDLCDPDGELRYSHDCYLKTFAQQGHKIGADFILHDEAQDANPVTLQILVNQDGTQVVHVGDSFQSIFGWRGAVDAMELARRGGAEMAWLTQSFRFGPTIAGLANRLLTVLDGELRLVGTDSIDSHIGHLTDPDAILCRTNAESVNQVLAAQRRGLRPHLVGWGREVTAFAEAARDLKAGLGTSHLELACFDSWREVVEFVALDPQGDELRMLVELVEEYGPEAIITALTGMPDEAHADAVISTAHRAKGRQWPTVQIGPDFDPVDDDREIAPEEIRLLYMAVTRARYVVDVTAIVRLLARLGVRL